KRAVDGRLVDAVYPTSQFKDAVQKEANALAVASDRPASGRGITLTPLNPTVTDAAVTYSAVSLTFNRDKRTAELTVQAPSGPQQTTPEELLRASEHMWA